MSYTIVNPADETIVRTVEHVGLDETDIAIEQAVIAQRVWAALAPTDRAQALRRFADAVDSDLEHLASLEVSNSGHPITLSPKL
jgi:acyl-CoA reductase-like NAD-dependent aldehyde dehydrogenase